jgi:hypothetical protein
MSDLIFNENQIENLFNGWNITGVSIRSKDSFYFLLREEQKEDEPSKSDIDYKTRCVGYFGFLPADQSRVASFDIEYFNRPRIATHFNELIQVVVVKANGEAFARGAGKQGMEEIEKGTKLNINRVKCLLGNVYAVGTDRDVYKRVGVGSWEAFRYEIPKPKSSDEWRHTGFNDIAAFSNGDLYAVGGKGDVWSFSCERKEWIQCAFPSNIQLFNVVCTPDGFVYIGAEGGTLFKGKGDVWVKIFEGEYTVPYNDLIWFKNQILASSDFGFYRLQNDVITRSDQEPYLGHMDIFDGTLLIAAFNYAWLYDGKDWKTILKPNS